MHLEVCEQQKGSMCHSTEVKVCLSNTCWAKIQEIWLWFLAMTQVLLCHCDQIVVYKFCAFNRKGFPHVLHPRCLFVMLLKHSNKHNKVLSS